MSSRAQGPAHLHPPRRRLDAKRTGTRRRSRTWPRVAAEVAGPLLLIGALAWPLLFTNATFNEDWLNHLWYMWHQSIALRDTHHPSLFLDYSTGVFYPLYAFYGGTLYTLAGTLSLALGNAPLDAYVLTFLLGFAAAYGGWYWLARSRGLRSWPAHLPGLVFVTSASYLTTVYGLGDWPEFIAVSTLPLLIASGLSVLDSPRLRAWPALALALSSLVFFGSHLLTVIWGTTLLALTTLAIVVCVPQARHRVTRAGLLRLLALALPAALVSSWYLLPTLAYESQTVIAHSYPHFRKLLQSTLYTVAARHLFTLTRARDAGTILRLALPVLAIAWVLGSVAILLATRRVPRLLLVLAGATTLLVVLMTHAGLILALPRLYASLQFSFRLESFVLLGVSGSLLVALTLIGEDERHTIHPRWLRQWRWLLVPIAAVSVLGAIEQVDAYAPGASRATALASFSVPPHDQQEGLLDYVDDDLPILRTALPRVSFAPSTVPGGRTSALAPRGVRLVDTNLRSAPGLVHVSGARIVGTDAQADDVLEVEHVASQRTGRFASRRTGRVAITVGPSDELAVVAGRVMSVAALIVLAFELALLLARRARATRP